MIGKVLRGRDIRRLLYYLYGPGLANEHADPHLVAGFSDPADLEPDRRAGRTRDFRRLSGLLKQPLAGLRGRGYDKPVWHCAIRAAPEDPMLSDAEWALVAARVMHRTWLAPDWDELGVRWVAVRHAADHIHIVATLARQDGRRASTWNENARQDFPTGLSPTQAAAGPACSGSSQPDRVSPQRAGSRRAARRH